MQKHTKANRTSRLLRREITPIVLAAGLIVGGSTIPVTPTEAATPTAHQLQAYDTVRLQVNGQTLDMQGLLSAGRTMIPLRALSEALDFSISYDSEEQIYTIGSGVNQLQLTNGSYGPSMTVNNIYLGDYDPINVESRLYVSYRVLSDFLGLHGAWDNSTKTLNIVQDEQANAITLATETMNESVNGSEISIRYPQVEGDSMPTQRINETIQAQAEKYLQGVTETAEERPDDVRNYEFMHDFIVTYNQNGVLNVLTQDYNYVGGAHGIQSRTSLVFDLESGKQLSLQDVVGANTDYLQALEDVARTGLTEMDMYLGEFAGFDEDPQFYLKRDGIVMYFAPYEYTAYAAGFPEFYVPFGDLGIQMPFED
ncbi:DUF4163 domain-containing protein [Paenibacillus sp. IB182496]|uniref:DUF4163 domain-containing protein n=1 Tax=Paenibacillus sabuli TaxID=2772509 RepID=A0A927BPG0_9BACL|nr:stalk domain-containing protein [Paenibacillus sabuli]MBD2844318.1 DUF4163 domain-containing protein [Paenibacillus sabuli]